MSIPARLLTTVGCLALFGCGAPQDDITQRLFSSHNLLRHAGFTELGPISSGEVSPELSRTLRAVLARDTCYLMAAFGSSGLEDVGVTVVGPDESPLAEDRGVGRTAVVSFCAERAGEHSVTVTAQRGAGPFTLAYWYGGSLEASGGGGRGNALTLGQSVTGTLPPGQRFVDYTLQLRQSRLVTIDLVSGDFDTYLYLLRDGGEIERDDDGGGGLNSRISIPLEPGTYTVRVGSFGDRGSGQFTLVAR